MKRKIVCLAAGLLCMAQVSAADPGIYLSVAYLASDAEFSNHSDRDSGYELSAGYSLNDNLAVELNYLDFGTNELPRHPDAGGTIDSDGVALQFLARYPIGKFTLYGKFGNLWWDRDGELLTIAGPIRFNSDGNDLIYGVGGSYSVSTHFDIELEYQISELDGDDLQFTSLGISYNF